MESVLAELDQMPSKGGFELHGQLGLDVSDLALENLKLCEGVKMPDLISSLPAFAFLR